MRTGAVLGGFVLGFVLGGFAVTPDNAWLTLPVALGALAFVLGLVCGLIRTQLQPRGGTDE